VHPALLVTDESLAVLRLWQAWRGRPIMAMVAGVTGGAAFEAGRSAPVLPFPGALVQQPACLLEAFRICDEADAALDSPEQLTDR